MSPAVETPCALYDALVSIDIPSPKAQAVVDALEQDMTTTLATKSDLEDLRVATKSDLEGLRLATRSDLEALRAATKSDMEELRAATKSDMDELRAATKADLDQLDRDIRQESALFRKDMEIRLRDVTIHQGYMLTVGLGLLFAALKFTGSG